jgi:hypothetical protein
MPVRDRSRRVPLGRHAAPIAPPLAWVSGSTWSAPFTWTRGPRFVHSGHQQLTTGCSHSVACGGWFSGLPAGYRHPARCRRPTRAGLGRVRGDGVREDHREDGPCIGFVRSIRGSWVRHRASRHPGRAAPIASTRPRGASEMTSFTPAIPPRGQRRRNRSQPAPSSCEAIPDPTLPGRRRRLPQPPSRGHVDRPHAFAELDQRVHPPLRHPGARFRNASTSASKCWAICATLSWSTSLPTRPGETPSRSLLTSSCRAAGDAAAASPESTSQSAASQRQARPCPSECPTPALVTVTRVRVSAAPRTASASADTCRIAPPTTLRQVGARRRRVLAGGTRRRRVLTGRDTAPPRSRSFRATAG